MSLVVASGTAHGNSKVEVESLRPAALNLGRISRHKLSGKQHNSAPKRWTTARDGPTSESSIGWISTSHGRTGFYTGEAGGVKSTSSRNDFSTFVPRHSQILGQSGV